MRLEQAPENTAFANWLLDVGAGKGLDDVGNVTLPAHMHCGNTVKDLINATYPDIGVGNKDDQYFLDRTILSCKNDSVHDLNNEILSMFPGPSRLYTSADSVVLEDGAQDGFQPLPVEFLNSITTSGLPLAHLKLKEGCPLMLLRNLDPSIGLCNGTRMRLIRMKRHVLECCILGGRFKGNKVFIPRISLEPSDQELPGFKLRRHQFPVRLAFAMTINKSQGQSVEHVGLDLRTPVFSHGQLYVALSRCTSGARIKVLFPSDQRENKTMNIVYPEVLTGIL
jgi:hypothetical protein